MQKLNQTQQKHTLTINHQSKDGLETKRAYSGFGASQVCHLLTYLDTYPPIYSPGPTRGTFLVYIRGNAYYNTHICC